MRQKFWLWVMRFAYRRTVIVTQVPDGVPTLRSMDAPCSGYMPRRATLQDYVSCQTDGHYLCQECCHRQLLPRWPREADESIEEARQLMGMM